MARQSHRSSLIFGTLLYLLACAALAGCARAPLPAVKQEDTANLSTIGLAYNRATDKLGRPPKDLEELKPFLKELGDPEAILRSPHDGQPYVILFGRNIRKADVMPPPIIVYEQQGANGTRYVLTTMGVRPMSDEEFQKADVNKKL
jgi:hypothetical protein